MTNFQYDVFISKSTSWFQRFWRTEIYFWLNIHVWRRICEICIYVIVSSIFWLIFQVCKRCSFLFCISNIKLKNYPNLGFYSLLKLYWPTPGFYFYLSKFGRSYFNTMLVRGFYFTKSNFELYHVGPGF